MRRLVRRGGLRREDGQSIVLLAVFLPLVLIIAALVVDGSNEFVSKNSLQNAADAAALAGAEVLSDGTCTGDPCIGTWVNKYSGLNGGSSTMSNNCPATITNSTPSCYSWPYQTNSNNVEVWLSSQVSNSFSGIVGSGETVTARAVAGLVPGAAPPYSFVALNKSCDNHTLLVRAGGKLTVDNDIYVDSCNSPQDAFDVFGGGSISAPQIQVVGGWEVHDSSDIYIPTTSTTNCSLAASPGNSSTPLTATQPAGCPETGQPVLPDPFANKVSAPSDGSPSCVGTTYATASYSPEQTLDSSIDASTTSITVDGTAVQANDVIQIDGERMAVQTATANGDGTETLTVLRGQDGTTAAAHTEPTVTVTNDARVGNVATLTTSTADGLSDGDVIRVSGIDSSFNGTYTVSSIPDGTTDTPSTTRFSYANAGASVPAPITVVSASRSGGVATITTSSADGLSQGQTVTVDLTSDTSYNGTFTVSNILSPTSFQYSDVGGADNPTPVTVQQVSRFGNVATLTTQGAPGVSVGNTITVNLTGPNTSSFNGSYTVTAVTGNQVSYANTGPDLPTPTTGGSQNVTSWSRTSGVSTLTANNGGIGVGSLITVNLGSDTTGTFSGTFSVSAVGGTGLSYKQTGLANVAQTAPSPPAPPAPPNTNTYTPMVSVTGMSRSNNVATLTTTGNDGVGNNNQVLVDLTGSDTSFNGEFTVSSTSGSSQFSYPNPGPNVATTSTTGGEIKEMVGPSQPTTGTMTGPAVSETGTITGPDATAPAGATVTGPLYEVLKVVSSGSITGGTAAVPAACGISSGSTTLQPGTYYGGICIGGQAGKGCGSVSGGNCESASGYSEVQYATQQKLSQSMSTTSPTVNSSGTAIQNGDYIQIDQEKMLVISGGGTSTLTVLRGQLGTTGQTHNANAAIEYIVGTAHVTMAAGTYVMAGGGFFVCGGSSVSTPNGVTIYDTNDPSGSGTAAMLDQVELDTTGNVQLSPSESAPYTGLTIYENPSLELTNGACDPRSGGGTPSQQNIDQWDVAFISTASTGTNGELGSVSGTIYDPDQYAYFGDSMSGTANLAVFSGCIYINGADSTFDYESSGLFGVAAGLKQ